jgi:hypothetical protein
MNFRTVTLAWERGGPLAGAVLMAALWFWFKCPFPSNPDGLFGAAATVSSIFASFLGVSKALILTIKGTETFKVMSDRGYTVLLFAYLRDGIFASVFFASCSIIGFFIDHDVIVGHHHLFKIFQLVWIFAGALSLLTYVRISNILFKLLRIA